MIVTSKSEQIGEEATILSQIRWIRRWQSRADRIWPSRARKVHERRCWLEPLCERRLPRHAVVSHVSVDGIVTVTSKSEQIGEEVTAWFHWHRGHFFFEPFIQPIVHNDLHGADLALHFFCPSGCTVRCRLWFSWGRFCLWLPRLGLVCVWDPDGSAADVAICCYYMFYLFYNSRHKTDWWTLRWCENLVE